MIFTNSITAEGPQFSSETQSTVFVRAGLCGMYEMKLIIILQS